MGVYVFGTPSLWSWQPIRDGVLPHPHGGPWPPR